MAVATEFGPVREVWLEELGNSANKHSFLIRDDAYSKSGVVFGRTVRLGEPVSLGPLSTWRQTTWEGGHDQELWRDNAMYHKGTVDTATKRGKARLWPALGQLLASEGRANVTRLIVGSNDTGPERTSANCLYVGESNPYSSSVPTGGFRLYRIDPGGAVTTVKSDFASGINAFSPPDDDSRFIFIGCQNGEIWKYRQDTGEIALEFTNTDGAVQPNSIIQFGGSIYWLAGRTLIKRTWQEGGTHTLDDIFRPGGCPISRGMAVWNNRLWFGAITFDAHTRVFQTDGVTVVEAFQFPDEFRIHAMQVHYGALYIAGARGGADNVSWIGQVWKYTGSSLVKLYESGTGEDGEDHTVWDLAVDRQYLAWVQNATASNNYVSGIRLYDAEVDAIVMGPSRSEVGNTEVGSLAFWDHSFVGSFWSKGTSNIYVRDVRKGGKVRLTTTSNPSRYLLSSRYDGDLPGEDKVWLKMRVRCAVPADTQIKCYVILDEGAEQLISTITYNGSAAWRTAAILLKSGGEYLRSGNVQYKLVLENIDTTNADSTANPEVDSVEIDWMPAPTKRRQWRIRAIASDAQNRLDGTANPLTTATAIRDKLEEFYGNGAPVLFYDAKSTGGTPSSGGVEVWVQEWLDQAYRVDSEGTEVNADVSLTLLEAV